VRVIDFSRVFAGPAATQILGDLGAEIVKIEEPSAGDEARFLGLRDGNMPERGVSACFLALNRNKQSLTLDLKTEAGIAVARRLAAGADVLVHNFRPGAMTRFGLSYEALRAANPGLVYCEFTAYGADGPMAHIGANDLALQAHSGLMSMTGEPGRPPVRVGTAAIDLHGALAMVAGILGALYHRERTGEGQFVESSLLLSSAHLMSYFYTEYWLDGVERRAMGTANHLSVPNQVFPTKDGGVVIIAPSDVMWRRCAEALDPERLAKPEYRTTTDRQRLKDEVIGAITDVTLSMTSDEIIERLGAVRVNVAKVNSVGEAASSEQLRAAGGVVEFDYGGEHVQAVSAPFRMHGTPATVRRAPPGLGADTVEVLKTFSFGDDEIAVATRGGAFGPPRD
jgi:crotonobetainyl-CoA:carnitine CoA-transferase CaiB-like acyl-CoA transferase